jgi:hypothetical protein
LDNILLNFEGDIKVRVSIKHRFVILELARKLIKDKFYMKGVELLHTLLQKFLERKDMKVQRLMYGVQV